VASQFHTSYYNDHISELSKLGQQSSLLDYLERFDELLAQFDVTGEMVLFFFGEVYTLYWRSL